MYRRTTITRRILDSMVRHGRLFLLGLLGVVTLTTLIVAMRSKTYTASAATKVMSESELTSVLGYQTTSYVTPGEQNVARFYDLLKDNLPGGFLDLMLRRAALDRPIDLDPHTSDARREKLMKGLTAATDSDDVFTIFLVWDNAAECERIVRAAQAQYIDAIGTSKEASSIATMEFLDGQIAIYQGRMETAEQALIAYKQNHSGQLPEAQEAEVQQLSQLKADYDYLKITANDSNLKRTALQKRLALVRPTTILSQTLAESPSIVALKSLETRRADLIADGWLSTSDNVRGIDQQAATLQDSIERDRASMAAISAHMDSASDPNVVETKLTDNPEFQSLSEQLTDATIDQETQQARMALMQQQINTYEQHVRSLPAAQRDLADKTRDYDVLKHQYEDLLERREQERIKANVDKVSTSSSFEPLGAVVAESTVSRTKQALLIAMSVVLGFVVGAVLVILREWADTTVYYPEDAERLLGVPILAALPDMPAMIAGQTGTRTGIPPGASVAPALSPAPVSAPSQN